MKNLKNIFFLTLYALFSLSILLCIQLFFATRGWGLFSPLALLLPDILSILLFVFFLTSLLWDIPFSLHSALKVQKLYKPPSWVRFFMVLLFFDAVAVAIIYFTNIPMPQIGFSAHILVRFHLIVKWLSQILPIWWLFYLAFPSMVLIITYPLIKTFSFEEMKKNWRFAYETVGSENDEFNIAPAAKLIADELMKLAEYVIVVEISAGMGWGKSSFARMTIENFNAEDTLYSYLSLTETNEARDLERLFAERWSETLTERYPKLQVFQFLPFMEAVLRDTGNEWLKPLLRCDRGLISTLTGCYDKNAVKECPKEVSPETARLFGNVNKIREKRWLFVFDEVDRAEFDEIFRMIEIIERFKNLGCYGLPVQMIFVLCISNEDLQARLKTHKRSEPKTMLITDFLFMNPKNITHKFKLPMPNRTKRREFAKKQIERTSQSMQKNVSIDLARMYDVADPFIKWPEDSDVAMLHVIKILADESPRMINRTLGGWKLTLGALEAKAGKAFKVRLADTILMEYAKIRHPVLFEFFETICQDSPVYFYETWKENRELKRILGDEKDKDKVIFTWIKDETGKDVSEHDKPIIKELIGLIGHFCIDKIETSRISHAPEYFGSLSLQETMRRYVGFSPDDPANSLENSILWLQEHEAGKLKLEQLKSQDVLDYSGYLKDFGVDNDKILYDVFMEIKKRLINESFEFKSNSGIDSRIGSAVYHLKEKMILLVELNYSLDTIRDALKEFLTASNVSTYAKYTFSNYLLETNEPRDILVIQKIREGYNNYMILGLIKSVLDEANSRYFSELC